MPYLPPSIPEFKAQFLGDFPWAVPPTSVGGSGAQITISSASGPNNSIQASDITLVSGGSGYTKGTPTIIVQQGRGMGCVLTPILAGGVLVGVTVQSGGYGYTQPTYIRVYISSGAGDNTDQSRVTDYDIDRAQVAATQFNITQELFTGQQAFSYAYNLLSAHYLLIQAANSQAGLAGKAEWITNSKSIGDVSESFVIPDRIMRSPFLSKLGRTSYGAEFAELVAPSLIGNMASFHRNTLP